MREPHGKLVRNTYESHIEVLYWCALNSAYLALDLRFVMDPPLPSCFCLNDQVPSVIHCSRDDSLKAPFYGEVREYVLVTVGRRCCSFALSITHVTDSSAL